MSATTSMSSGIASRYATAVFELAEESGALEALERDIELLDSALAESEDLRHVIRSPLYSRDETAKAMLAVAKALGLSDLMARTLGLMAQKRRLFVLPEFIRQIRKRIADMRGETTAEVVAAKPLTKAQSEKLAAVLAEAVGKKVNLHVAVDEGLIGGLVVKVGSKMVDTSIRSRLAALKNAMKEVG